MEEFEAIVKNVDLKKLKITPSVKSLPLIG